MASWLDSVATDLFLWAVIPLLLGGGLFLTLRFGVVQLRRLPEAFRATVGQASGVSPPTQPE